ncbi:MAG: phosphoribosylformylglycinamidine cyclo-ligase, partial [Eggerthellales bacterium]|nr:phosphoribosylformylglycinamidine cyclo-ligase [Eggerthellales bacterium]
MTDRVQVSPAEAEDAPQMPSWVTDDAVTYAQSGVDIEEGARAVDAIKDAVHSTYRPEVIGDIGGFGGLFSLAAAKDMEDPITVSGTDGVGTKLRLAQICDKHDTVGIDLVAMCVNDVLATGAEPLFFLDYVAVGKLKSESMSEIVSGIAEGCRQAGCALIGGEMAEHPGVMDPDDYDLSGFCVALVDRPKMIGPDNVREGDVLVGMASTGIHSNGFSLVRKVCVEGKTHYELRLEREELDGESLETALLRPTRIYVKSVLAALKEH